MKIIFRRCVIKVIRRVDSYKVTCRKCKSVIGFERDDIGTSPLSRGGFIVCPVCSNEIQIIVASSMSGKEDFMVREVEPIYANCDNEETGLGEDNG